MWFIGSMVWIVYCLDKIIYLLYILYFREFLVFVLFDGGW